LAQTEQASIGSFRMAERRAKAKAKAQSKCFVEFSCSICLMYRARMRLSPCQHVVTCEACTELIAQCPTCRAVIESKHKMKLKQLESYFPKQATVKVTSQMHLQEEDKPRTQGKLFMESFWTHQRIAALIEWRLYLRLHVWLFNLIFNLSYFNLMLASVLLAYSSPAVYILDKLRLQQTRPFYGKGCSELQSISWRGNEAVVVWVESYKVRSYGTVFWETEPWSYDETSPDLVVEMELQTMLTSFFAEQLGRFAWTAVVYNTRDYCYGGLSIMLFCIGLNLDMFFYELWAKASVEEVAES